jgi:hypothetical protein
MGVLALLSVVVFLGLLAGLVAALMAYAAMRRIAASDGELRGRGIARAGLILGVVAFVAGAIIAIVTIGSGFGSLGSFGL